ncbi:MAG TPA: hypothetical protein VLH75_12520 [Longimicrobiales bacterium]|nr:hypothetical protein [Longimicrobiales bacterium]
MSAQSQISATISAATKEQLGRFTESHGLRKHHVVEQALLLFMQARTELPDEALVPARLVLENEAFDRIVEAIESPAAPTDVLRALVHGSRR